MLGVDPREVALLFSHKSALRFTYTAIRLLVSHLVQTIGVVLFVTVYYIAGGGQRFRNVRGRGRQTLGVSATDSGRKLPYYRRERRRGDDSGGNAGQTRHQESG